MRTNLGATALGGPQAWLSVAVVALLTMWTSGTALAQDTALPDIRVALVADRSELTVGDPIGLTLEVVHPEDHVVVVPRLDTDWGVFQVRRQTTANVAQNRDGTRTTSQQLEVTLFAPGTFETPELPLSIRLPDGGVERMSPAPVRLTVVSVLSGDDETLRDIRAPADFSTPLWEQLYFRILLLNVVVVVILAVVGLTFYRRTRQGQETSAPAVQHRSPWEVAFDEFDRIESLELPRRGRLKEYYALVSRSLRVYLQSAHLGEVGSAGAVDMTTDEIAAALKGSTLSHENTLEVVALLTEADLVKFANDTPTEAQARAVLARARRVVEDTQTDMGLPAHPDHRSAEGGPPA